MIETISFKSQNYLKLQSEGFAAQFAFGFAYKLLSGRGCDIGCMKAEWAFPGAIPIDCDFEDNFDAMNLPYGQYDYLFSSHCLEHLPDWVGAIDYWLTKLKTGGTLFLYLPNMDHQAYWHPASNRKHIHYLTPFLLKSYFEHRSELVKNVFVTEGCDLNSSFYAICEKI